MRSFLRLLVAICLVIATAHLLRQSGALIDLKSALEPNSPAYQASIALTRNRGTTKPIVFGDDWFRQRLRKTCDARNWIYAKTPQTYFEGLAGLVTYAAERTTGPIIVQIGNYTWFPNRKIQNLRFDYLPAVHGLSPAEMWQSTRLLFDFLADLARRDNYGRAMAKDSGYFFASADLNGFASLVEAVKAADGRIFLVSADKRDLKDVTPLQVSRRDDAISLNPDIGLYTGIEAFVEATGCAPQRVPNAKN